MKVWVYGLLVILGLTGCSTTSMKGTPFYTGEFEKREGPAADRVNLWPLLYYRDPALSVLWPIMEVSPEHLAVRPIYSVHDRHKDESVHNVVWPICQFDTRYNRNRIFPVYWGDDYFNVFPLYWHRGEPVAGEGHNALFPFWIWNKKDDGHSMHVFWPLYAKRDYPEDQSWRLWPLYGTGVKRDEWHRYAAWPIHFAYSNSIESAHAVLPLYWKHQDDRKKTFVSLPYSRSTALHSGGKSWDLTLPLCYRRWEGDQSKWTAYPLLSWGSGNAGESKNRYALGLGGRYKTDDHSRHYLFPFYYYNQTPESRSIYTLPWWNKSNADGTGGHALFPVYYRNRYDGGSSFYTLPWWHRENSDGSGWHSLFPFYYYNYAENASTFYSLPWVQVKEENGSSWQAVFPFYYRSASEAGAFTLVPFYARKEHGDGSTAWQCLVPLIYLNNDYDSHFLTVFGGRWTMGDQQNWLALPLLSWGSKDAQQGRNVYLAGLAGQRWFEEEKSHYVIPFYYSAPYSDSFVSLPYFTWSSGYRQTRVITPLLSGWYNEGGVTRSMIALGLAGHRSGSTSDFSYLIPVYYSAPQNGTFASLAYAAWDTDTSRVYAIPPLLSAWYKGDAGTSGSVLLLGLAGHRGGDQHARHYIMPFYYSAPHQNSFFSLPYSRWETEEDTKHFVPLLLSGWSKGENSKSAMLGAGLVHWQSDEEGKSSHVLPIYAWSQENYLYTLLFGGNKRMSYYATPLVGRYGGEEGSSGSWFAPFYWHRKKDSGEVKGNYFLLGHYRKQDADREYGVYGIYNNYRWENYSSKDEEDRHLVSRGQSSRTLLFLGGDKERWAYEKDEQTGKEKLTSYTKNQKLFLVWKRTIKDRAAKGERLETSALLGFIYDKRHEQKTGEKPHDYLRRRILWRLYHYERLNGDATTDVFPGITADSYKNGYKKYSFLWRLFRYEKDPETGETELDLLFIPIKR